MHLPEIVNGSWFTPIKSGLMVHRFRKETTNYELRTIYPDEGRANRKSKGFTLIELLVVISIIAILMAVATVSYLNAQQKGRDNKRKSDLKAVQQALEIYYNQNGKYPNTTTGLITCNNSDTSSRSWGTTSFTCNLITYMNPLPKDPAFSGSTNYYYYSNNSTSPQTYQLYAKIENTKDQDLANTIQSQCSTNAPTDPVGYTYKTSGLWYCVVNP